MKLNSTNLFQYYLFHPRSQNLNGKDKRIATAITLLLGVCTIGITHLFCRIFLYHDLSKKAASSANKTEELFSSRVRQQAPSAESIEVVNPEHLLTPSTGLFYHFFQENGRDNRGRALGEILGWDNSRKESCHDYIQWLFPTYQRSQFNASVPELTLNEVKAMKQNPEIMNNMRRTFQVMLQFYGFSYDTSTKKVERARDFDARVAQWCTRGNHNFLRITRILDSLKCFGLGTEARAFFAALEDLRQTHEISETTFRFWSNAVAKDYA